jgi:hypothetical protein
MKIFRIILASVIVLSFSNILLIETGVSEVYALSPQTKKSSSKPVFKSIEEGIAEGNVGKFSLYFSSLTYLSLSNGTSGYYSSNQAFYVLQDFFKINRASTFRFVAIYDESDTPFATGVYTYELKGRKSNTQVFISLRYSGNNWKITQITFN